MGHIFFYWLYSFIYIRSSFYALAYIVVLNAGTSLTTVLQREVYIGETRKRKGTQKKNRKKKSVEITLTYTKVKKSRKSGVQKKFFFISHSLTQKKPLYI